MSVTQTGRQHYPAPTLGRAFWALYKNAPGVIQAEASSLLRGANQRMTDAPDLWGDSYTDAVMTRYIKRRIKTYADVQAAKSVYAKSADAGRPFYTNVTGDCMEGLNIADGDYLLWNPAKRPKAAGDVCLIAAHDKTGLSSKLTLMVKAFHGVYCGQWVRTHYADKPDKTFFVESFGFIAVASACYTADRRLKWKRDISDYPKELSAERTLDEEPSNVGGFFGINCTGDTAELQHNTLDRLTGRATV